MKGLRPGDRWTLGAAICLVAGAVLLLVAWYDISGTNQVYEQLPYLVSAGFTGLGLVMLGCALLVAGRYDRVERRLARLVDAVTEPADGSEPPSPPSPPSRPAPTVPAPAMSAESPAAPDASTETVVVPNGTTFHRPTCPLVQGKPVTPADPAAVAAGRLTPCPVCDPA